MGTDIHSVAQVFVNQKWLSVATEIGGGDRSYVTFAVLADVRNGYGVAGVPTHERAEPIAPRRGLPEDFEMDEYEYCRVDGRAYWMGSHSFTWVTLAEMKAYPTNKEFRRHGVLSLAEYLACKAENRTPESWCGWSSAPTMDEDEYLALSSSQRALLPKEQCIRYSWMDTFTEATQLPRYIADLEELKRIYEVESDEHVRLVMGFDS